MNLINQWLEKFKGYWKGLEQRQRRNLIMVGIFFVAIVSLLSWFALRPNYIVVVTDNSPADLGAVTQKLDQLKIPYQTTATQVLVPEQYQDQARMQLAMNNLPPSGSLGYGVFDNTSILGMTQDQFNVKYQQAMEGEVENAIETLNGVQKAKVDIVLPQQQLFVQQSTQDAKASVVLSVQPGVKLTADQVAGIQQLVSHSIQGLQPQNVSIVDQNGVRLVDDSGMAVGEASGSAALTKEQQIEQQVENDATTKIRDALERLVGLNNVDVVVHANLDFSQTTWNDKTLTPVVKQQPGGAIISSQTQTEDSTGTTGGGAAGTSTNNPNANNYNSATNGSQTDSKKDIIDNYDWNTQTVNGKSAPFVIKGYTVSVLVNMPNLSPTMKSQISQFVATAIGFSNDGSANASITVTNGSFQAPANPFTQNSNAFYKQPWFFGGLAAALVLLGGGIFFAGRRRKSAEMSVPEVPKAPVEVPPIVVEETENQKMRKQLEKLANQKPEEFVNLLRTWLVEE